MILVERHCLKSTPKLREQFFFSKNLFNSALYLLRQHFFAGNSYPLSYLDIYKELKTSEDYKSLPAKVSQQTLMKAQKCMVSYFAALQSYNADPTRFLGKPKLPKYKDKEKGQYMLVFTMQAVSSKGLKKGLIIPSGTDIKVSTRKENIKEVRLLPDREGFIAEIVYEVEEEKLKEEGYIAAIDLGINNFCALSSDKRGSQPLLINGRPLKSINQFYNKEKARLQSNLKDSQKTSKKIQNLTRKRNFKIKDYLHKASRKIIDFCVSENISTLIVGKNDFWKQDVKMGERNNQNFVQIPFAQFIEMLRYKCKLKGITLVTHEESYTSKCSFLDLEPVCFHLKYKGKRVKRGLFKSSRGRLINADTNASYNILRKVVPDAFSKGIEGVIVHPKSISIDLN